MTQAQALVQWKTFQHPVFSSEEEQTGEKTPTHKRQEIVWKAKNKMDRTRQIHYKQGANNSGRKYLLGKVRTLILRLQSEVKAI